MSQRAPCKKYPSAPFFSKFTVCFCKCVDTQKNYTAGWRTCFCISVVCRPVCCFQLLLLMRVGRGQRGCGWAPSATFIYIYIYDFLFIIPRFKVTSSGCTEEEIKIRFDSLSHFFLQDKTLQRKSKFLKFVRPCNIYSRQISYHEKNVICF